MRRAARETLKIDVRVDSKHWNDARRANTLMRRAVAKAAATVSTTGAELAIVLTDDSAIRLLNREWRGIDAATNVLSFPIEGAGDGANGGVAMGVIERPRLIGDIVLAYETIDREAREQSKPFAHHAAHLAVHGFLHLIGYDHERDEDAEEMENAERKILRQLSIPDPYRSPSKPDSGRRTHMQSTARNLKR